MSSHDAPFGLCEVVTLQQDVVRHGELPDIVEERSVGQKKDTSLAHSQGASDLDREITDPSGMLRRVAVTRIDGASDALELDRACGASRRGQPGCGLGLRHAYPVSTRTRGALHADDGPASVGRTGGLPSAYTRPVPVAGPIPRVRLAIGRALAAAVARLARWSGRGGGTTLPGRVLLAVAPDAIGELGRRLSQGTALISATNGKTTTTAMAAAILRDDFQLAHNQAGANLASGVASTLVASSSAELGLLEVDEAAFAGLCRALAPRAVVLGNLFRDQLDRYGELETIAESWRGAIGALPDDCIVVASADDPRIHDIVAAHGEVHTFGIDDVAAGSERPGHASDARTCLTCGEALEYGVAYVGHLGEWSCTSCDAQRPTPEFRARNIREARLEGVRFELSTPEGTAEVELQVPGLYNVYNALGAACLAHTLGVAVADIAARLGEFRPAFGRLERISIADKSLLLWLAKNPAGANEVVRTLAGAGPLHAVVIALNDDIADGRDVSWIWDVDLEDLMPHVSRVVASGSRAEELALRFKYGGFPTERLELERDLATALDRGLELTPPGEELAVIPTYTAMLALQRILTTRGLAPPYWQRANG